MSEKKQKVPKLRFPGFTGEWEQRKLCEVAEITMGQSPSSKNYTDNPEDFILVQGNADLKNGAVVPRLWTKEVTKTAEANSIILTVRAPVGEVAISGYDVVLGRGVAGIKGNDFIYYVLLCLKEFHYWEKLSSGSTFDSINSNDIKEILINMPNEKEQEVITGQLKNIDNLITLHLHKLENLKLKKKALLQKLFPKNGMQFPELRFPGFTDDWEQRKLCEVAEITMGQSPSSKNYTDNPEDFILVQGNADLKNGAVVPRLWTKEVTKTAEANSIILTVRAPVGEVAISGYDVVLGRGVAGIKGNDFIYYVLLCLKEFHYWEKLSSGSTFDSINSNDIKEILINMPDEKEQEVITSQLKNVDNLITLHQCKYFPSFHNVRKI